MVAGIICEYNPFHRGHAAMLEQVRRWGADTIVCAMSGNFVQRGEAALFSKFARAEMALCGGADLVLELPAPWAMASAETFARGGVEILTMAGCDTIAFGSECGDAAVIGGVADTLLRPDFGEKVREKLTSGIPYAAARQQAAEELMGADAAILSRPNDILAVEYAKAVREKRFDIKLLAVPRIAVAHDGAAAGEYASASHIRELLQNGENGAAFDYIPTYSARIIQNEIENGRMIDPARLEIAMLSRLRQLREEDFARYDAGGEGLYHRFYDGVHSAATADELLAAVKTKRYPMARLRRMAMAAWLDIPAAPEQVPYLRVLAANEKGRALLKKLQRQGVPILTKPADVERLGCKAKSLFSSEADITDQFSLGMTSPQRPGADWRYTPWMK